MAAGKIDAQDRKDLNKFTKFLAYKTAQIIVQSRLGEKIETKCKSETSGIDWFNLAIHDLPDVAVETRKAICGEVLTNNLPICVEISLKTADGYQMVLETWSLGVIQEQCDPSVKVTCTVYNRMGLMLKSLISVTRITPAYKLSRQQSADSFIIYYRIYIGEPQLENLGEENKHVRIGSLPTPMGTLLLTVTYRTKMTISPTVDKKTEVIMKSDHFHSKTHTESLKHFNYKRCEAKREINLDMPMRAGAFVDMANVKQFSDPNFVLPEEPPLSWLLNNVREADLPDIINPLMPDTPATQPDLDVKDTNETLLDPQNESQDSNGISIPRRESVWSNLLKEDKIFTKEIHFPFATSADNSPFLHLASFFRECENAPKVLLSESSNTSDSSALASSPAPTEEVGKQLEQFESSLQEYDSVVASLFDSSESLQFK